MYAPRRLLESGTDCSKSLELFRRAIMPFSACGSPLYNAVPINRVSVIRHSV
jgi:hypothetical protein